MNIYKVRSRLMFLKCILYPASRGFGGSPRKFLPIRRPAPIKTVRVRIGIPGIERNVVIPIFFGITQVGNAGICQQPEPLGGCAFGQATIQHVPGKTRGGFRKLETHFTPVVNIPRVTNFHWRIDVPTPQNRNAFR